MRKIAMMAGMLMISSTCVFAMPDRVGKADAGFNVGGLVSDSGTLDAAAYYGLSVSYGINDWFAIGAESGYGDSRTNFTVGGTEHEAPLSRIPLFADLIFRYPRPENNYAPYGVIGLGVLFTSIHGTGTLSDSRFKLDVDNSFAAKFGAGVDWAVNDQWMLNVEASYVWVGTDARIRSLGTASTVDSGGLNYWMFTGGAKYLFN